MKIHTFNIKIATTDQSNSKKVKDAITSAISEYEGMYDVTDIFTYKITSDKTNKIVYKDPTNVETDEQIYKWYNTAENHLKQLK